MVFAVYCGHGLGACRSRELFQESIFVACMGPNHFSLFSHKKCQTYLKTLNVAFCMVFAVYCGHGLGACRSRELFQESIFVACMGPNHFSLFSHKKCQTYLKTLKSGLHPCRPSKSPLEKHFRGVHG
jgi:hypothetical protein